MEFAAASAAAVAAAAAAARQMRGARAGVVAAGADASSPALDGEEILWQMNLRGSESMEYGTYPERPGEPDCAYYLRTGLCRFGMTCRFNHPPDRRLAIAAASMKGGYPERVGQPECQYYLKTGTCKFGATCKFDHPRDKAGIASRVQLSISGYPLRPWFRYVVLLFILLYIRLRVRFSSLILGSLQAGLCRELLLLLALDGKALRVMLILFYLRGWYKYPTGTPIQDNWDLYHLRRIGNNHQEMFNYMELLIRVNPAEDRPIDPTRCLWLSLGCRGRVCSQRGPTNQTANFT